MSQLWQVLPVWTYQLMFLCIDECLIYLRFLHAWSFTIGLGDFVCVLSFFVCFDLLAHYQNCLFIFDRSFDQLLVLALAINLRFYLLRGHPHIPCHFYSTWLPWTTNVFSDLAFAYHRDDRLSHQSSRVTGWWRCNNTWIQIFCLSNELRKNLDVWLLKSYVIRLYTLCLLPRCHCLVLVVFVMFCCLLAKSLIEESIIVGFVSIHLILVIV